MEGEVEDPPPPAIVEEVEEMAKERTRSGSMDPKYLSRMKIKLVLILLVIETFLAALFVIGNSGWGLGGKLRRMIDPNKKKQVQNLSLILFLALSTSYIIFDVRYLQGLVGRNVKFLWKVLIFLSVVTAVVTDDSDEMFIVIGLTIVFSIPSAILYFCRKGYNLPVFFLAGVKQIVSVVVAFAFLGIWLFLVLSTWSEEIGCNDMGLWNVVTREYFYRRAECPFQIEVIQYNNLNASVTHDYINCTFTEGCGVYEGFNYSTALIDEETSGTVETCSIRTRRLVDKLAENYVAVAGIEGENAAPMQIERKGIDGALVISDYNDKYVISYRARYHGCLRGFLLWLSPFVGAASYLWLGVVMALLKFEATRDMSRAHRESKLMRWMLMIVVLGVWVAASIGGADMDLANVVMSFTAFNILLFIGTMKAFVGWSEFVGYLSQSSVAQQMKSLSSSDIVRALLVLVGGPIVMLSLVFDSLCQIIRRLGIIPWMRRIQSPEERKRWVTRETYGYLHKVSPWPWTMILKLVILLGILYMIMQVLVSKYLSVAMSWFNTWIAEQGFSIAQVSGIFTCIGITIFLNPLTPGVPVYVSGGIIVVEASRAEIGFWPACLYSIVLCTLLKFLAIAVQQKCFGEVLGKYVTIRKMIQVNSKTTRAIKLILSAPGISSDKVMVLCGGPDWPVSVTTGILGLSLPQMLLGSTPIIFLIAPCVVSGAMLLRIDDGPEWKSFSVVSIGFAVAIQFVAMGYAMNAIARVTHEKAKELDNMPDDLEVLEYTKKSRAKLELRMKFEDWHGNRLPNLIRVTLVVGAVSSMVAFWLTNAFGSKCFVPFAVSDSFEEKLGGNALNLILHPYGHTAIIATVVAFVCYFIQDQWATRRISRESAVSVVPISALPLKN